MRYELAMVARTCTNNFRVVVSPYVQHCPFEALEQKWGPKTIILSKEIEPSFFLAKMPKIFKIFGVNLAKHSVWRPNSEFRSLK